MAGPPNEGTRDWDAGSYDRLSEPQLARGRALLERLELGGDETVIDAGCGSGRVTSLIMGAVPAGKVIAVDGSAGMVEYARERLGAGAEVIHSDLLELELDGVADAVFSNATFHWILDHERLFARIASWLRPGGRLEAQCGGTDNMARFYGVVDRIAAREPYVATLGQLPASRNFAGAGETEDLLERAGLVDVRCWLESSPRYPPEPRAHIESVCLGVHLEALPEGQRDAFVRDVHEAWGPDHVLDYVGLNISARKPPAG